MSITDGQMANDSTAKPNTSDTYSIEDLKSYIQKVKDIDDLEFIEQQLLRTKSTNDGTTPLNHKDELNESVRHQYDPTFQLKFIDGDKDFFDKVKQTLKTIYKNTTKHLKAKPGIVLELFSLPLRLVSQSMQQSTTTLLGKENITLELPKLSMNKVVEAMDELLISINNSKLVIAANEPKQGKIVASTVPSSANNLR
jgi:hypothetical protein